MGLISPKILINIDSHLAINLKNKKSNYNHGNSIYIENLAFR